jgi:tryptophan synthase alpha chain
LVSQHSSGFVYLVSRTGVTGEQTSLSGAARSLVQRMRAFTTLPLAVGFGISTPQQVAEAAETADGVVVGSAIVRFIENHAADPALPAQLQQFVRELSAPLRTS